MIFLAISTSVFAQGQPDSLNHLSRSATLTFVQRDGTCINGAITKADSTTITVEPYQKPPVTLTRSDLFQISQGNALLYSGRSAWSDVINTHLAPREAFVLTTVSGKLIKGTPVTVNADHIKLKHGLTTTLFPLSQIKTVDYLRWKPESDGFDFMLQEAPYMVLFYPELYYRALGLEGRISARLYDVSKPQDPTISAIRSCPYGAPSPVSKSPDPSLNP
jgi:hypothetical protein